MDAQGKAAPFMITGKKQEALIFVHGFTASPSEILPTAVLLNELGDVTVKGVLLPGHGKQPEDLNRTGWLDWSQAVNSECLLLLEEYRRVFVAGLSMGGMLALYAGLQVKGLSGVISINAPFLVKDSRGIVWTRFLKYWRPYWPKDSIDYQLRQAGRYALDCYPLKAMDSMWKLRKMLIKQMPALKLPVLAIQSLMDESVSPASADFIAQTCKKAPVRKVELPHSQHVATMGSEKEKIAAEILRFISNNL